MLEIRPATTQATDIATIVYQRHAMFVDMGYPDDAHMAEMSRLYADWVKTTMAAGDYVAWLMVDDDDNPIAGAAVFLYGWGPRPGDFMMRRGCVMNVYVEPAYRRQGLARQLMAQVTKWAREAKLVTLVLNASEKGRPLYESLGFNMTNEMQIKL